MENQLISTLKKNKLFEGIDVDNLSFDEVTGRLITISEGKILFHEGDPANAIYLIVSGEVNVLKKNDSSSQTINIGENDFFGQDEILENTDRTSSAIILRDSYLIMLNRQELDSLRNQEMAITENLMKNFAVENLYQSNENNNSIEISKNENSEEVILQKTIVDNNFSVNNENNPVINEDLPEVKLDLEINEQTQNNETINSSLNENEIDLQLNNEDPEINLSIQDENIEADELAETNEKDFDLNPEINSTPENITENLPPIADEKVNSTQKIENPDEIEKNKEEKQKLNFSSSEIKTKSLTEEHLLKIIKASEIVNSKLTLDELLESIVEVATDITNCDRGTLYLVDKERNELWSKVLMGDNLKEIRLNIGDGIAGWVAKSAEIVNISDVKSDERFNSNFDKSSGYETKSMICMPIKNREKEIIGVIQLLNSKNGKFSELDEELLNAISINSAVALENAKLMQELLHGERVSSLGKMANFLIQDIKKPVLVSKRYAEHLKNKDLPPDIHQVLDMMIEQINHVADLVQTTSCYAEGTSMLRMVNTTVKEVIEDFANRIESFVQSKGVNVSINLAVDAKIKIDFKEFFQCFNHIIKNACDAMPEGGLIDILSSKENEFAIISIKDNGIGIPETVIGKIFEPFMTYGKKEGTGLGLSITKKIIEDHGGKIEVISELGEGAEIKIYLPEVSVF